MRLVLALSAALLAAPVAQAATTTPFTLDFSGDICTTTTGACTNGSSISQDYGDIAGMLDIIYDANRNTPASDDLRHWGSGYETLANVAYGTNGGGGLSILFQPLAGHVVTITGFDIAPYANRSRNTLVQVIDTATDALLVDDDFAPLPTGVVTSFSGTWTSASGIQINLGPDAWDVGISNITGSVSVIPLPAAGWLLLGALAGLGLAARRRRTATAA